VCQKIEDGRVIDLAYCTEEIECRNICNEHRNGDLR